MEAKERKSLQTRDTNQSGFVPSVKGRILYVEDHPDSAELIRVYLGMYEFEVVIAETIAEASRLACTSRFDLYLLDYLLADGSGIQLCQEIRRWDLKTPIVFLSGKAYAADRREALTAGAQAYFTKPVELGDLLSTLTAFVSNSAVNKTSVGALL